MKNPFYYFSRAVIFIRDFIVSIGMLFCMVGLILMALLVYACGLIASLFEKRRKE